MRQINQAWTVWDDERITSFLTKEPLGDEPEDFSRLLHAYRSMRVDDFRVFQSGLRPKAVTYRPRANPVSRKEVIKLTDSQQIF